MTSLPFKYTLKYTLFLTSEYQKNILLSEFQIRLSEFDFGEGFYLNIMEFLIVFADRS